VPRCADLALPERHLGLVPAGEQATAETVIAGAALAAAANLDIDRLPALARSSVFAGAAPLAPLMPLGQRIAIARDDAFLFVYPAVLEGWRRQGAELTFFSPLADEVPDPAADAVYLPGGYPELHGGRLAAAERFFAALKRAATGG